MAIRRDSAEVLARDADQLKNDPRFINLMDGVRSAIISELENSASDGSEAFERWQAELCRELRTVSRMKRSLAVRADLQQFKDAGFKPHEHNEEE